MLLREAFDRDPRRPLERAVTLVDPAQFHAELGEYVLTSDAAHGIEQILDSYTFPAGPTTVWISGAKGSGKSTLLKILAHSLGDVPGAQLGRKAVTDHLRPQLVGEFLGTLLARVAAVPATSLVLSGDQMARTLGDGAEGALVSGLLGEFREGCCTSTSISPNPPSVEALSSEIRAWLDRQPDGYRLNFFIDDVDRFLRSSAQRMLELKSSVESLMRFGRERIGIFLASSEIPATTMATGTARSDLSMIHSRFHTRIRLTLGGISEVIQRRLLRKSYAGAVALSAIYDSEAPWLREIVGPLGQANVDLGKKEFVAYYPFLPHQFYLLQDAIDAFADRGLTAGREVSVLSAVQSRLAATGSEPLGRLAAVDEMLSGILKRLNFPARPTLEQGLSAFGSTLASRILTLLFALNFTGAIRPTPATLTALVCDHIGQDLCALAEEVYEALHLLEQSGHARRNGDCYEYVGIEG